MANKNDGDKVTAQDIFQVFARVLYELELAHEIVKELAKHLSIPKEEWEQIVERAYSNLENRKDEIVHFYFGGENNK